MKVKSFIKPVHLTGVRALSVADLKGVKNSWLSADKNKRSTELNKPSIGYKIDTLQKLVATSLF